MKRVSYKIAKAIKEAGYPQDYKNAEDIYTNLNGGIWVKPTYLEVWLWLWREKGTPIRVDYAFCGIDDQINDPEEAIVGAIEHLVNNNLI